MSMYVLIWLRHQMGKFERWDLLTCYPKPVDLRFEAAVLMLQQVYNQISFSSLIQPTNLSFLNLSYLANFIFQDEDMQQQIIRETFHLVSKRDDAVCNFLEGGT